ncbi:MAG: polyphosphate polymerase domain-containing protein [Muribaculaceae bacterium]|nr:polyphosphate polymerase domain-containing protein [Muribaculaceae bacterium]
MTETNVIIDNDIIQSFEPISLADMGKVKLMNRIDSKYVTTVGKIRELLKAISSDYYIQEISGRCNMPYYTRYYDTPEMDMYYQHQRGKKSRQKIRMRRYEGSDTPPFIEIKSKNNKGRTRKKRVEMKDDTDLLSYQSFISANSNYDPENLVAQIENHFYRITLVDKAMTERITIDTNLEFHNLTTDAKVNLYEIGIIEWKRDGNLCKSGLDNYLKDLRIHPGGFSKYCIGMAVTNPDMKQNRIKKRIRKVKSLIEK